MKLLKTPYFYFIFTLLLILETIIANLEGLDFLHYVSKPLIVITLLFYFINNSNQLSTYIRKLTVLALVFSLLGDVLLLFISATEIFFISGLLAFLIAHILYVLVFYKQQNKNRKALVFVSFLLIYGFVLFWLIKPNLNNLLVPVIIYMLAILTMATFAFLRKKSANKLGYKLILFGAILFMVSDSLLALNKFYTEIPFEGFSIMLTYGLAQFFIIEGLLKPTEH